MSDRTLRPELDCAKQILFVNNGSGNVHVSFVNGMAAYGPHLPSDLVEDVGDSKVAAKSLGSSSVADAPAAGDGEERGEVKVAEDGDVLESDDKEEKSVASTAGSYVFDDWKCLLTNKLLVLIVLLLVWHPAMLAYCSLVRIRLFQRWRPLFQRLLNLLEF